MTQERMLTPRQERFVEEYIVDLNATQAATRAGYSAKTAMQQGDRLLRNVEVATAIQQAKLERSQRTQVTADWVIEQYRRIAAADMRHYTTWGPMGVTLKNSSELTDEQAAAVAEVSESTSKDGGSLKFKLHDKLKALDALAEHTGVIKNPSMVLNAEKMIVVFDL